MSAICRGCGCTEYDPCILHTSAFSTAETCHWARPGLCSACVRPHTRKEGPQHDRRTNYPVRVIVWSNGMVMVFDYHGVQLGKLQGAIADVRAKGELAALLPEEQWKWRIWTGSAPGSASMEWAEGRAREIARFHGIELGAGRVMADTEDLDGATVFPPFDC